MKRFFFFILLLLISKTIFAQSDTIKPGQVVFYTDTSRHIQTNSPNLETIRRKNQVYLELFGSTGVMGIIGPRDWGLFSFNYERTIWTNKYGFLTTRIGFAKSDWYKYYSLPWIEYSFPILINESFLKGKHHFEIGGGTTLSVVNYGENTIRWDKNNFALSGNFMYRFQKPKGRLVIRLGYTPMIYYNVPDTYMFDVLLINFGTSIGFAF